MGLFGKIGPFLIFLIFVQAHDKGNDPNIPYDWIWNIDADLEDNYRSTNETCWERCFQIKDTTFERFNIVYKDLYMMGMKARNLKNRYGVNGTAIIIDSTLASYHSLAGLDEEDSGAFLWAFQKKLASAMAFLIEGDNLYNPMYIMQFNQEAG